MIVGPAMRSIPSAVGWGRLGVISVTALAIGLGLSCRVRPGDPNADKLAKPDPPEYVERLTFEMRGIPGSGLLQIHQMGGTVDFEYTLLSQRVRWATREGTLMGIGWADYRGTCKKEPQSGPGSSRGKMVCSAPFVFFMPAASSTGAICYESLDLGRAACPGEGPVFDIIDDLFQIGEKLLAFHAAGTGENYKSFREPLRKVYGQVRELRDLIQAHPPEGH